MADDGDGRYSGQSCGHQQLCSVRDESLDEAGESVQDARCLAWVQLEAAGDILGDAASGDDGNGIVRCAQVGKADKSGDA